jgi:hypothetical protein
MPTNYTTYHDTCSPNSENNLELSCENDALAAIDPPETRFYSKEEVLHILWVAFRLDEQEFRVIRYRLSVPVATYEDMAMAMSMTRQGLHKIIRRIRKEAHPLAFMFPVKKPKSY